MLNLLRNLVVVNPHTSPAPSNWSCKPSESVKSSYEAAQKSPQLTYSLKRPSGLRKDYIWTPEKFHESRRKYAEKYRQVQEARKARKSSLNPFPVPSLLTSGVCDLSRKIAKSLGNPSSRVRNKNRKLDSSSEDEVEIVLEEHYNISAVSRTAGITTDIAVST